MDQPTEPFEFAEPLEPPERSGGVDFGEESQVQVQGDVAGRDKIDRVDIHLPPPPRKGCYAQVAENVKFALFLGLVLIAIGVVFRANLSLLRPGTPTPTVTSTVEVTSVPALVITPTGTPKTPTVEATPTRSGGLPPEALTATASRGGTPRFRVTPTADRRTPPTVRPSATPTRTPTPSATPLPTRAATPTSSPTPIPRPPSPTPLPPRPPTPLPCTASAQIVPSGKTVTLGEVFSLSVSVSCVNELATYRVEVRFDPAVLTAEDMTDGGFLGSAGGTVFISSPSIDNNGGRTTLGAAITSSGPYPSGSGTLASVVLRAVDLGNSGIGLSVELSDRNGRALPVSTAGGSVQVVPLPTPTP